MDLSNADLQNLAMHYVGNESQPLQLADEPVHLNADLKEKLEQWMLFPFVNASERMECWHPESLT